MTTASVTRTPAITVLNPWAAAIAWLGKSVENRTWAPPASLAGGRLLIHAGKGWDRDGLTTLRRVYRVDDALRHVVPSAIVASAILDGYCTPQFCSGSCSRWAIPGQYHWLLTDVVAFTDPVVDVAGRQGLWYPAGDLADRAATAYAGSCGT